MTFAIDAFDTFGPYWEFFEQSGLTGDVLKSIAPIVSPILILGSGQGLVSETLTALGHDVTNVDCSRAMIEYAKSRRHLETLFGDAASIALGRHFATVIISTGVLTQANVQTRFMTDVLNNADRHLRDDGHVVLAYFRRSRAMAVLEGLGLLGHPSTNARLWEERASLEAMKAGLVKCGFDHQMLDTVFALFEEPLDRQRQLLANVGNAYVRTRGVAVPPPEFLDALAEFGAYHLSSGSEQAVRAAIEECHTIVSRVDPDATTTIVVYRRP